MTTAVARNWYVLKAKPRQELRVITHLRLRADGLDTFLPKIETVRRREGRRCAMLEPMFPGYLFVRMRLTPRSWNVVRWTPGVNGVLGDGQFPIAVPDDVIETIWQRVADLGFARVGIHLLPGTRVRVTTGTFAGLEGIFERHVSRSGRVRVLMEMLNRRAPIELDELDLEQVAQ